MPLHALFDSTVFISAFLRPNGVAGVLLNAAKQQVYPCSLSPEILAEVERSLAYPRIQERYHYSTDDIVEFCDSLRAMLPMVLPIPQMPSVSRDPNDDFILACAIAATATHLVTRDKDLLVLNVYEGITILPPEAFIALLRAEHLL